MKKDSVKLKKVQKTLLKAVKHSSMVSNQAMHRKFHLPRSSEYGYTAMVPVWKLLKELKKAKLIE